MFRRFYQSAIVFFKSLFHLTSISDISPQIFETLEDIDIKHRSLRAGRPKGASLAQKNLKNFFERASGIGPPFQPWQGRVIATIRRPPTLRFGGQARCVSRRLNMLCAWGENRTLYTRIFLVIFLSFLKDRTISSPPFAKEGVGRFCEIIVGTHSLVSTPSSRPCAP